MTLEEAVLPEASPLAKPTHLASVPSARLAVVELEVVPVNGAADSTVQLAVDGGSAAKDRAVHPSGRGRRDGVGARRELAAELVVERSEPAEGVGLVVLERGEV